ncbi:hypothetical protein PIB30_002380 [Stylosanthes scabra]|uniref:Uncharacterized protein n=1 Tax=Stylosanthes scabra TaxID=79078 RepID=A0ABU6V2B9_9FABA|nr:hypothetical protein [Stylosanthes scabra]
MHYSKIPGRALPHHQQYRFTPPPVPSKIQQLDSQQQPTLGLDWAYLVPHSPRNKYFS